MAEDRLHEVHAMVTELWKNYKTCYEIVANTDEWWDRMTGSFSDLADKFKNDEIALRLAIAMSNDLERICKTRKWN